GDDTNTPADSGNGSGSGSGGGNKVQTVSCTGATIASTVTAVDLVMHYQYKDDMTGVTPPTISVGGIVEFKTSTTHNVIPTTGASFPSDPGMSVDYNKDVCLKFTTAGDFNFACLTHGFKGKIVVN
ncbi:MAG: hypothetical protein ABI678_16465, partial [Kofleriaceae bacterium]